METHQGRAVALRQQSLESLCAALQLVDGARLLAIFVDAQNDAAVEKLFVDFNFCRGEDDHHRPLDVVLLGYQLAGLRIFSRRGDGQLTFRLQKLERVARLLGSFLFADRQDLVLQILALHVEERPSSHGRVPLAFFFRHERQHRVHQCRLSRSRGALDQDG
jgi:hypothetical protein